MWEDFRQRVKWAIWDVHRIMYVLFPQPPGTERSSVIMEGEKCSPWRQMVCPSRTVPFTARHRPFCLSELQAAHLSVGGTVPAQWLAHRLCLSWDEWRTVPAAFHCIPGTGNRMCMSYISLLFLFFAVFGSYNKRNVWNIYFVCSSQHKI